MTQKIKLMSDEEVKSKVDYSFGHLLYSDYALISVVCEKMIDECEKRATEKMREVAYKAWCDSCDLYDLSVNPNCPQDFEAWFQQFLKEQNSNSKKCVNCDKLDKLDFMKSEPEGYYCEGCWDAVKG